MKDVTKRFIEDIENQLELDIRGGFLKWKNAYELLCAIKDLVGKTIHRLENIENDKGPFNNISAKHMLLLVVAALISMS